MSFWKNHRLVLMVLSLLLCFAMLTASAEETGVVTLNVSNTPVRGNVLLEKTGLQLVRFQDEQDAYGHTIMKPVFEERFLDGAVFELHAAEDITGAEGSVFYTQDQLIETLTTDGTGAVRSQLLPLGQYYLVEISAPDGYVFSTEPYHFTLMARDHETAVVEVKVCASNAYLPARVRLSKEKEVTKITATDNLVRQTIEHVPGEGFVFGLYNGEVITYGDMQKLPANTLMASAVSDANGVLTFSGLYPHGCYYVKELSAPSGWKLSAEQYPIMLTPENKAVDENVISVTLAEPIVNELIYTPVTLTKTDITGTETLPGALIELTDSSNHVIYRAYTDANGEIPDIPLVPGTYTFRETYAPEGYALNAAEATFSVTADGRVLGDTIIKDEVNRVMLKKVRENGDGLAGATFGIYDAAGQLVQEQTSDEDGHIVFTKLGYGSYVIREIEAPYGFHLSTGEWPITIDGTYTNPLQILTTVINEDAPGWIRITKTNALDGHSIAGVQFDIYAANADGTAGDPISTMITDENGVAVSESLLVGSYLVKERAHPTGYTGELYSEQITVEMDETVERTVENMPIQGRIRMLKTDDETGNALSGAVFTVIRVSGLPSHEGETDGEVMAVITSDENGLAETGLLTWGEYEVIETTVPAGYLDSGYDVRVRVGGA